MAYKILYIEDQDPGSFMAELKNKGFEVSHIDPEKFEDLIQSVSGHDLLLIDFRLSGKKAMFDAPTIAQTLRTKNSDKHRDIPIILISSEKKISDYYNDFTSQDLFDLSISKQHFLENTPKYALRFKSLISTYSIISREKFDAKKILNINDQKASSLDYRIFDKLGNDIFGHDVFAFSSFVLNNLIGSIGVLIGEDVLSARLGVSKQSPDWTKLLDKFIDFKYTGIFSDSYNRWWSTDLNQWWKEFDNNKSTLRKLSAEQRVALLRERTELSLDVQPKTKYAKSSSFWTICQETSLPIDPVDGLELTRRDLLPWQESEYISIQAGVEPTRFDAQSNPIFHKYVKPLEMKRLRTISNS